MLLAVPQCHAQQKQSINFPESCSINKCDSGWQHNDVCFQHFPEAVKSALCFVLCHDTNEYRDTGNITTLKQCVNEFFWYNVKLFAALKVCFEFMMMSSYRIEHTNICTQQGVSSLRSSSTLLIWPCHVLIWQSHAQCSPAVTSLPKQQLSHWHTMYLGISRSSPAENRPVSHKCHVMFSKALLNYGWHLFRNRNACQSWLWTVLGLYHSVNSPAQVSIAPHLTYTIETRMCKQCKVLH